MPIRSTHRAEWTTVLAAALLCVTVAVIHVLDQGGVTAYAGDPWWIGWGYRAVEIGGVLTAIALVARRDWVLSWVAAFLVGFGPFAVYLLTRGPGLPGDPSDVGAWGDSLGTTSLLVEGTLFLTALLVLVMSRRAIRAVDAYPVGPAVSAPQTRVEV